MSRSWADRARAVIASAVADGLAAMEDFASIVKRIDAAYPFGPRLHWPL